LSEASGTRAVDIYTPLDDGAGSLQPGYDNGDGLHPSLDAHSEVIAPLIDAALDAINLEGDASEVSADSGQYTADALTWSADGWVSVKIVTTDINNLSVGAAFSQQLVATGSEPITWSVTGYTADGTTWTVDSDIYTADGYPGLPDGLSLSSTGLLTGTPTTAGAYSATITATNAGGSDADVFAGTVEAAAVTGTVVVGPGGSGYPVYWQGKRRKRRLEEQPNLHLKKVLDDVVNELYGELTEDDVPPAVQAKAAKLVKPFVAQKDKKLAIPPPAAVDWAALERDATRVRQLIALWRKQEEDVEIEAEDEYLLMMS
jgi:hypothetical protein